jgi:hypothetical protein
LGDMKIMGEQGKVEIENKGFKEVCGNRKFEWV